MNGKWKILVVDDEVSMRESLAAWLREDGYLVETAASGREAVEMARAVPYDIYFIDLKMPPGINGIETMLEIRKSQEDATVVIVTAYATVDTAISAIKEGAQEYMVKPCNPEEISLFVQRVIKLKSLQNENVYLRRKLAKQNTFEDIISKTPRMHEIFELIKEVASQRSTVLIQGESGTGKELVARAIHQAGDRAGRPFVGVSCAALAETLLESELFGHERGSFTGAMARKRGKFEVAGGGSIFLDEIGDISPKLQMDLLRVLQERSYFRIGGTEEIPMEARVIAATNRDLHEAVEQGEFRDDLFYRLNVINIRIPALRERREDIPLLVDHFIGRLAIETNKPVRDISKGALKMLMNHDWPGNVRELENALERAIVTARGRGAGDRGFRFPGGSPARQPPLGGAGRAVPGGDGEEGRGIHPADDGRQHQGSGRDPGGGPLHPVRQDQEVRHFPLTGAGLSFPGRPAPRCCPSRPRGRPAPDRSPACRRRPGSCRPRRVPGSPAAIPVPAASTAGPPRPAAGGVVSASSPDGATRYSQSSPGRPRSSTVPPMGAARRTFRAPRSMVAQRCPRVRCLPASGRVTRTGVPKQRRANSSRPTVKVPSAWGCTQV